jgi:uncharacterized membrane protein
MVLPAPNSQDFITITDYKDVYNRYFAPDPFTVSISASGTQLGGIKGNTFTDRTDKIKTGMFVFYFAFYGAFTHETDYNKRATITLKSAYICPLTVDSITTLYGNCEQLNTLATKFQRDVLDGKNRNSNNYVSNSRTGYNENTSDTPPPNFTDGSTTDETDPTDSQAMKLINGYKQIVYMTDTLIYDLWDLMKDNISGNMPTKSGQYALSGAGNGLTGVITAPNVIQVVVADGKTEYNFGFNNDTSAKNILEDPIYKTYKRYVLFARDLLNALQKRPNFSDYNNDKNYLPTPATDKSLSATLALGVKALTAAISALESSYDSRYNRNGHYRDVYANRANINTNLKELHRFPGTSVDTANRQYLATMAAGTIWTVFASALVYYVFTEL